MKKQINLDEINQEETEDFLPEKEMETEVKPKETVLDVSEGKVTLDSGEEESVTLKSQTKVTIESVPTQFSDLSDQKVHFSDFYQDARSFLDKANSTKFILITFLMVTIPILLIYGYVSEDIYKDMVILLSITYLGVDVYEKKSLIKK